MGKRKRSGQTASSATKVGNNNIPTPPQDDGDQEVIRSAGSIISPEEIEITVDTLQTLAKHPNVIKSKMCKDVRTAVYDFRQACTTGLNTAENTNLTSRISGALTDSKYTEALILLAEMRIRGESPKLGALCRWVRDLDVVSGLSMKVEGVSKTTTVRSAKDKELLRVLDAILRVTGPTDTNVEDTCRASDPIALQLAWNLRDQNKSPLQIHNSVVDKSILAVNPTDIKDRFRIIETTSGLNRKPPNHYPAVLYASQDDAVLLDNATNTTCYHHPVVPNLRLIKDVLSSTECKSIIAAAESIEFIPDAPIRDEGEETSVLAHNFYWVVDSAFHDKLWQRVEQYVPDQVAGKQVRGINRRFRVYRYVPGAEYRCHIGEYPFSLTSLSLPTYFLIPSHLLPLDHKSH